MLWTWVARFHIGSNLKLHLQSGCGNTIHFIISVTFYEIHVLESDQVVIEMKPWLLLTSTLVLSTKSLDTSRNETTLTLHVDGMRNGNDTGTALTSDDTDTAPTGNSTVTALTGSNGTDTGPTGNGTDTASTGNDTDTASTSDGTDTALTGNGPDTALTGNGTAATRPPGKYNRHVSNQGDIFIARRL